MLTRVPAHGLLRSQKFPAAQASQVLAVSARWSAAMHMHTVMGIAVSVLVYSAQHGRLGHSVSPQFPGQSLTQLQE